MGKLILAIGESGTGKSRALMNLDPETTLLITPNKKDLPFRGGSVKYSTEKKNVVQAKNFSEISEVLKAVNAGKKIKTVVVEDLSHAMSHRVMQDAKIAGFNKWTDFAVDIYNSLIKIEDSLRDDLYIIVIAHTDRSTDVQGNQIITLATSGKLLENTIKIPSYFTYILHTDVREEGGVMQYRFLTNSDGVRVAKSPEGCFEKYIPNDYKLVIESIDKYQKEV